MYHQFNIQQFYVLPTQCIYVFCVDLRTNSHYFPIQHSLTGLYNRDTACVYCAVQTGYLYICIYITNKTVQYGRCHGTGGHSPDSHRGIPLNCSHSVSPPQTDIEPRYCWTRFYSRASAVIPRDTINSVPLDNGQTCSDVTLTADMH